VRDGLEKASGLATSAIGGGLSGLSGLPGLGSLPGVGGAGGAGGAGGLGPGPAGDESEAGS
jgi:hypothetical protein